MNQQQIVVDISAAGTVSIDAQGFQGKSCEDATAELELVLGGGQAKKDKKPEYFNPATTAQSNKMTF